MNDPLVCLFFSLENLLPLLSPLRYSNVCFLFILQFMAFRGLSIKVTKLSCPCSFDNIDKYKNKSSLKKGPRGCLNKSLCFVYGLNFEKTNFERTNHGGFKKLLTLSFWDLKKPKFPSEIKWTVPYNLIELMYIWYSRVFADLISKKIITIVQLNKVILLKLHICEIQFNRD